MKSLKIFLITAAVSLFLFCASTAQAFDTVYYKDSKVGIFKITLDRADLKDHPIKSIVPVYDPAVLSEVYTFDSRSEKRDFVEMGADESSKEELRKKAQAIDEKRYELEREKSKFFEENSFFEKYLQRVKSGELKASAEDAKDAGKKIEANKKKDERTRR